jgi:hypothetical protein
MSDRAPSDGILGLLSQKAAYDTVRYLAATEAGVTVAQVVAAVGADASSMLRSLALEGFVSRTGTWDLPPSDLTTFALTPRGQELVGHMDRLDEWARGRDSRRRSPREG